MTEDYTTAEIVRTLKRIEEKVDHIAAGYVPRSEFDMYKETAGREVGEIKARVAKVDQKVESARVPTATVISLVMSSVLAVVVIVQAIMQAT